MKTITFGLLLLLFISCDNTQTYDCDGVLGCDNGCNSGAVLDNCGVCDTNDLNNDELVNIFDIIILVDLILN